MRTQLRSLSTRRGRTKMGVVACAVALLFATSCGASAGVELTENSGSNATSDQTESSAEAPAESDAQDTETQEADPVDVVEAEPAPAEEAADEPASSPQIGQGTFELVLENGETFVAPINCVLAPQIAAGSEILFTAGGQHEDRFYDVTQWGETSFGGTQEVEIVDTSSFDGLWRATGSSGLVLELNGNTITGSGDFYQGEDFNGPYTPGNLTVTC